MFLQATADDYDSLPIAEFGKAMLKGMGWRPGEAIGLTNKRSVSKHVFLLKCILVIASVKIPNDDAQVDASRYDSERGGTASVCV